ncbi:HNH endonuclease [Neobacillus sp. C211]|uniref:HNH endonuclease n=1 Tax=unclassified Neobacillus TaxID=2675272 RepID=UPI00397A8128
MGKTTKGKVINPARRYLADIVGSYIDNSIKNKIGSGFNIIGNLDDDWNDTLSHFEGKCIYCGEEKKGAITQEHLKRIVDGGLHCKSNVVPACGDCNIRRGSKKWENHVRETKNPGSVERIAKVKEFIKNCGLDEVEKHPASKNFGNMMSVYEDWIKEDIEGFAKGWVEQDKGSRDYAYCIMELGDWKKIEKRNNFKIKRMTKINEFSYPTLAYSDYILTFANVLYSEVGKKVNLMLLCIDLRNINYKRQKFGGFEDFGDLPVIEESVNLSCVTARKFVKQGRRKKRKYVIPNEINWNHPNNIIREK